MSNEITTLPGGEMVEFVPANVVLVGKSATDKRMSIVPDLQAEAGAYLITLKGKVGDAIRERFAQGGEARLARAMVDGNYRPLAQALAVLLGRNVTITKRDDVRAMRWSFENEIFNLKNSGLNSKGEDSAQKKALMKAMALVAEVQAQGDAIYAQRQAEKAARLSASTSDAAAPAAANEAPGT